MRLCVQLYSQYRYRSLLRTLSLPLLYQMVCCCHLHRSSPGDYHQHYVVAGVHLAGAEAAVSQHPEAGQYLGATGFHQVLAASRLYHVDS